MSKLQELIAEKARLENEISALMSASRREAIEKVRALIQEFDLTAEEVGRTAGLARGTRKNGAAGKTGAKVQPKYRDPESGATWSGRGVAPRWIAGKDLQTLRQDLGFPSELGDAHVLRKAIALRVIFQDAKPEGGTHIESRVRKLTAQIHRSGFVGRMGRRAEWLRTRMVAGLWSISSWPQRVSRRRR